MRGGLQDGTRHIWVVPHTCIWNVPVPLSWTLAPAATCVCCSCVPVPVPVLALDVLAVGCMDDAVLGEALAAESWA